MNTVITQAGVYDMDAETYHSDPVPGGSLSSTGARTLIKPGGPARYRHEQEHGGERRPEFDIGTAAHKLVLGAGPELVRVEARDWRTKAACAERDDAYDAGKVPLLAADHDRVHAMAAALRRHPIASALLDPDRGQPERAIFWQDEEAGVWRRALVDWLPELGTRRAIVVDYKTTVSAEDDAIRKSVARYGYHQQGPWYIDAVRAVGYPDDTAFLFIFQEKTAPYLVNVVQLDTLAMTIGGDLNRRALEIYHDCATTGMWPGYSTDIQLISLPPWVERQAFQETA